YPAAIYELDAAEVIPLPSPGSFVVCVGFPQYLRENGDPYSLRYGAQSACLRVTTAGEDYFVCQFERDQWLSFFDGAIPPPGTEIGGMSGGPVLLVGRLHFPLVGVVIEFHVDYELLYVRS